MDDTTRQDSDVHDVLDRYISPGGWTNEWAEIVERGRHRRRRTWIAGTAVTALACGALGVLTVALIPSGAVTRDGAPSSTSSPNVLPSAATVDAYPILGDTGVVSARRADPAEFHEPADRECVKFTIRASAAGDATWNHVCGPQVGRDDPQRTGGRQIDDRPVLIYGVRPVDSTSVVIRGADVQQDGLVYSAIVPPTLDVTVEFMKGKDVMRYVHQGKSSPPSRTVPPAGDGSP